MIGLQAAWGNRNPKQSNTEKPNGEGRKDEETDDDMEI